MKTLSIVLLTLNRRALGIYVLAIGLLFSFGKLSGHSTASPAQNTPQASRCALADLRGTYGFFRSGVNPQGPIAAVGLNQFDGDGNVTVVQTTNRNGTITQGGFAGTYDVTPDCRGIFYDASGDVGLHLVLLDGGNEFFFLSVSPGNTITGHGKRVAPWSR